MGFLVDGAIGGAMVRWCGGRRKEICVFVLTVYGMEVSQEGWLWCYFARAKDKIWRFVPPTFFSQMQ